MVFKPYFISPAEDLLYSSNNDDEDSDYILIPVSKIDVEQPVFSAILDTEEISKYLNNLIGTIDRLTISRYQTFDELMTAMNNIIYTSGFVNNIIHSSWWTWICNLH